MKSLKLILVICWCLSIIIAPINAMEQNELELVNRRITSFNQVIPDSHPRLILLQKELPDFRNFIKANIQTNSYPDVFKNLILEPNFQSLPPEPPAPKGTGATMKEIWRNGYSVAFKTASTAQRYAFSYLITGEASYGREAARWLIHLSSWDVNGGINIKTNDEAFIQSLRPMIFAYDWAYSAFTENERRIVQQALQLRLSILYKHVSRKFSLIDPTPPDNSLSHPMRFISTLGIGGLVLYQDLPEAPEYLSWAYEYYLRQFPVWGGADGGWSEGLNYWATAINQHFQFLDAMKTIGETELFQKPFFKNTPYFALYNQQPHIASSFGDLCNITKPNQNVGLIMEKFAVLYQDPYLMRYFETIFERYPNKYSYYEFSVFDTIMHLYRKKQTPVHSANLAELPRSRYFKDIGWVAFHSQLGNKYNDIMLGFKSSPYGSASHSFSDQNSFVINAFGEPLAISSGYREWYDSPHHVGWTRTTASKNAILFGDLGQPIKEPSATGEIIRFYTGDNFDFTTGDASKAYGGIVTQALRHILFIGRNYFLILDELQSTNSIKHQWLLHAKKELQLAPEQNLVSIHKGKSNLAVNFLIPGPNDLRFKQTNQFAVGVHPDFKTKMENEWHFSAQTKQSQNKRDFLTILSPYQTGQTTPVQSRLLKSTSGYAILVAASQRQDTILIAKESERLVQTDSQYLQGAAGIISNYSDRTYIALIEGTKLVTPSINLSTTVPGNFEISYDLDSITLSAHTKAPGTVTLNLPFIPSKISGIAKDCWSFNPNNLTLQLSLSSLNKIIISKN